MNSRTVTAVLFVILCLSLSGLVLRRQIAAHPVSNLPDSAANTPDQPNPQEINLPPAFLGQRVNRLTWHIAHPKQRQAAISSIQGQLDALRVRDFEKAQYYQSRALRRHFRSAEEFTDMVRSAYPEFGHARSAQFDSVWVDAPAQHADVLVTVTGENGIRARAMYELVFEKRIYRVAGVFGGQPLAP